MYNWLVFLHIFFAFAFMLSHGAYAAAMLKFRAEPDPEQSLTFFNNLPSKNFGRYLYIAMGVFGFSASFMTGWWKQGWIWASAVVLLVVTFVMYKYGAGYYYIISDTARRLIEARKTNTNVEAAQKEFDDARFTPHAMIVSVVGIVGLAIILWLMRFKPF